MFVMIWDGGPMRIFIFYGVLEGTGISVEMSLLDLSLTIIDTLMVGYIT